MYLPANTIVIILSMPPKGTAAVPKRDETLSALWPDQAVPEAIGKTLQLCSGEASPLGSALRCTPQSPL